MVRMSESIPALYSEYGSKSLELEETTVGYMASLIIKW